MKITRDLMDSIINEACLAGSIYTMPYHTAINFSDWSYMTIARDKNDITIYSRTGKIISWFFVE